MLAGFGGAATNIGDPTTGGTMGLFDGAIGSIIGGLGGGLLGLAGAQDQNAANAQQAVQQEQFQQTMSNTAHQREVADLKAAGLNPMLSVNAGASTPSGAMASMVNTMSPVQTGITNAVEGAQKARGLQQQQDMNQSNIDFNKANANLVGMKTKTESANATAAAETAKMNALSRKRMEAGQGAAEATAPYAPWAELGKNGTAILSNASDAISNFIPAGGVAKQATKWLGRDERDAATRQDMLNKANDLFKH